MIVCSACGAHNEDAYKFCLQCGHEMADKTPRAASARRDSGRSPLQGLRARLNALKAGRDAMAKEKDEGDGRTEQVGQGLPGWTAPPSIEPPVIEPTALESPDDSADLSKTLVVESSQSTPESDAPDQDAAQTEELTGAERERLVNTGDIAVTQPAMGQVRLNISQSPVAAPVVRVSSAPQAAVAAEAERVTFETEEDAPSSDEETPVAEGQRPESPDAIDESAAQMAAEADTGAPPSDDEAPVAVGPPDDSPEATEGSAAQIDDADDSPIETSGSPENDAIDELQSNDEPLEPVSDSGGDQIIDSDGASSVQASAPSDEAPSLGQTPESSGETLVSDASDAEAEPSEPPVMTDANPPGDDFAPIEGQGVALATDETADPEPDQLPQQVHLDERPTLISEPLPPQAGLTCQACGAEVSPGYKFCGACGAPIVLDSASEPSPQTAVSVGHLVQIHPDGSEGEHVDLGDGNIVVGRDSNLGILANDPFLSSLHARFEYEDGWLTVHDLDSYNGVFIRLRDELTLVHGDLFRIGRQLLRYEDMRGARAGKKATADDTRALGSPRAGIWGRLVQVLDPQVELEKWVLRTPEVYLGRERGTISFPTDVFVSGTHCRLKRSEHGAILADLGSTNGTYYRLRQPTAVADGDFVLIGQQLFRVAMTP